LEIVYWFNKTNNKCTRGYCWKIKVCNYFWTS